MSAANQLNFNGRMLNNQGGLNADKIMLNVNTLQNSNKITGRKDIFINATDQLTQSNDGEVVSAGTMNLTSAKMDTAGRLTSKVLNINGSNWNNTAEVLTKGDTRITIAKTLNNSGKLDTTDIGALDLTADHLINSNSIKGKELRVTARQWDNSDIVLAKTFITTYNLSKLNNQSGGYIESGLGIKFDLDKVENSGQIISNGLQLNANKQWVTAPKWKFL